MRKPRKTVKRIIQFLPGDMPVVLVDDGRVTGEMWRKKINDALTEYARAFKRWCAGDQKLIGVDGLQVNLTTTQKGQRNDKKKGK
jgi:hypothetical protein